VTGCDDSLYERVGGEAFFVRLVDAFYAGVAGDDVLAPLYPEHRAAGGLAADHAAGGLAADPDFSDARHRLTLFLVQYWGGPTTYSDERGHPRLRMRHAPFPIGERERDRWLAHMTAAVDIAVADLEPGDRDAVRAELLGYFGPAADHMRNQGLQRMVHPG
jgi:hemoglobin